MSDLYRHFDPGLKPPQAANLLTLARHLVHHREPIEAAGGPLFGLVSMRRFRPLPPDIVASGEAPLPPLAYGPHAGISARPGDDWRAYLTRSFGVPFDGPLMHWIQTGAWRDTEPSALGVALRIAYVMDYGLPFDWQAITRGEAWTDYDDNGFLWDRLDMLPPGGTMAPLRQWPERPTSR